MDPLAPLEEAKILSLVVKAMFYRDCNQWQRVLDSFHPDASKTSCEISWMRGTAAEWVEGCKAIAARAHTTSHHVIHPIEAVINGDRAICYSTADMSVRATIQDVELDITSFVRFIHRAVRTRVPEGQKEWRLLTFQSIYVEDNISKTGVGSRRDDFVVSLNANARPSYKHLDWVLSQRGLTVAQDMPGVDIPESVEKIVIAAETWLRESDKE